MRKVREALLAFLMEATVSKDQILLAYLNEIYFGQRGKTSICGIKEASTYYFGKMPDRLSISESATLAAMVRNPGFYLKEKNIAALKERRNVVLKKLVKLKQITPYEAKKASKQPLILKNEDFYSREKYGYLLDQLQKDLSEVKVDVIWTTIDPLIQDLAETSLKTTLKVLRKKIDDESEEQKLQGSFLVTLPGSGEILAFYGGSSYLESQFNRVFEAKRQIGSTIKPWVMAAALMLREDLSPLTSILDEPMQLQVKRDELWEPRNYEDKFRHWITLRQALENSVNTATIKVANYVKFSRIQPVFREILPSFRTFHPSTAIGSLDLTLLDLLDMYQRFFHCQESGYRTFHYFVRQMRKELKNPFDCDVLFQVVDMMRGVIRRGTSTSLKYYIPKAVHSFAGKTGTTNEGRDSWFVGMDAALLAGAWIGYDLPKETELTGAGGGLRIFGTWIHRMVSRGYVPRLLELKHRLKPFYLSRIYYHAQGINQDVPIPRREWLPPDKNPKSWFNVKIH